MAQVGDYRPLSPQIPATDLAAAPAQAYAGSTYPEAPAALLKLRQEFRFVNLSAVAGLEEGFEETLTLHPRGGFRAVGLSLKTTNDLESLNRKWERLTKKIGHWRAADQKHRWVASAWLAAGPWLRRLKGYRHVPQLQAAIQKEIQQVNQRKTAQTA